MNAQAEARAVDVLAKEMRAGLEGVTPGPWTIIPAREYDGDDEDFIGAYTSPASIEGADGNPICSFGSEDGSGTLFENERDHEHLNRCSPDNIRALLDDRDAIAQQNAELRAELAALKKKAAAVVRPFVEYTPDRCFEGNERWKPAVCRDPGGGWYGAEDFRAARSFLDKWERRDV